MKEYIYILQTYEYDTYYSFSGISESEIFVHLNEDGARKHAEKMGLIVGDYPETVKNELNAVIEKEEVLD